VLPQKLGCKICATARLGGSSQRRYTQAELTVRLAEQEPASTEGIAGLLQFLRRLVGVYRGTTIAFVRATGFLESVMDVIRILLSILLPPLGVFLQVGLGLHFWLNILLTLLGYIPGVVHAIWIIARR
jgi:uncharacterized membrane protein YqaE (UPF0057 family)